METQRPKGTGSVYWDEKRQRYVGTLEAGWTARGTRRRLTVTGRTEREAKQKLKDKERDVLLAGTPAEGSRAGVTVKSWAEEWLATQERRMRPSAFAATRSQINAWAIPAIGHKRLDKLSPGDVRSVTRSILDAGRAISTANRAHSELLRMLNDAAADGRQVPSTVLTVVGPGTGRSDRDALTLADAAAVLVAARDEPDAARWVLALLQAMRPAEVLGLTWSRVDLEKGEVLIDWQLKSLPYRVPRNRDSGFRVPAGYDARKLHDSVHLVRPKTNSGWRRMPLTPWAVAALKQWQAVAPSSPHDLVFPRADGRGQDDKVDRAAWVALQDRAQVAHVDGTHGRHYDLYECRHTTATLLRESGVDDETIIAIMGHASILSTRAYLHTDQARMRAALDGVEARLIEG
jgi:integrase